MFLLGFLAGGFMGMLAVLWFVANPVVLAHVREFLDDRMNESEEETRKKIEDRLIGKLIDEKLPEIMKIIKERNK